MKNGDNNNHLVYTLEDDISDQVLKSKNEEDASSGSSSVALWIKSLKDNSAGFDDSKLDQDTTAGGSSSSDQDDLILGAEATDLRRRQKSQKHPASLRDSDSDGSSRWYSWTGRRTFLTNRLSYDRSLDSDTSGFSSVTSVSSLLTARESDPEDVLKGLGFRGPSVRDKIPDRFIDTGTICDGVDSEQFLYSVQDDSEDAGYTNSEIPPWVMARFDEIPRKFWNQMDDPLATSESTDAEQGLPLINEPSSDEAKEETPGLPRPSKVCPSKFGTYLEPVTEEAELSSQGSVTLSPIKTLSFESTRSTLKAYSQDGPSDSMAIPSLCDLWQTTEDEQEMNPGPIRSEGHGITPDDTGSNIPEEIAQGYNGDWIDKSRDDGLYNSTPAISDIQQIITENIPAIPSGPWGSPQTDTSVPALSAYFSSDGNTQASDNHRDSLELDGELTDNQCLEVTNNPLVKVENQCLTEVTDNVKTDISNVPDLQTLTQKYPTLNIPTVTISEPAGKSRKISTIQAPDIDLLLPVIWPKEGSEDADVPSSKNTVKNRSKGKVKVAQTKPTQLNLYASQNWAAVENEKKPKQIQFSHKGKPKSQRRLAFRSRKTADVKVTLSVSRCKKAAAKQVTVPKDHFGNIPCFSDLVIECSHKTAPYLTCSETSTSQSSGGSEAFTGERTFLPLPLRQTEIPGAQWNSKYGESSNSALCDRKKSSKYAKEGQDERLGKAIDSESRTSSRREECLNVGIDDSKSKHGASLKNGLSIEEELGGLQNSLKGVKMYKAGIHLMQLASSVETVMCSEKRPNRLQVCSSERLLDSIQKELKHLEEYILRLQKQLKAIKKQSREKELESPEDVQRRGSDFSDITRQLLQEQLKMFNSISSAAVSPASTPSGSVSHEESLSSETPDVLRHTDVMKLRREIQQLRQDSEERNSSIKEEILDEVRAEIRNCFKEFLQTKSQ